METILDGEIGLCSYTPHVLSWVWWHLSVILAFGTWRQKMKDILSITSGLYQPRLCETLEMGVLSNEREIYRDIYVYIKPQTVI